MLYNFPFHLDRYFVVPKERQTVDPAIQNSHAPHFASVVAWVAARYSDSVVDKDTTPCFLLDQDTGPPQSIKM